MKQDSPTVTRSPSASVCSRTGRPLTKVPLRLSRSESTRRSPARPTVQWRRESRESASRTRFEESRPTDSASSPSSKAEPFKGPAMKTTLGFMTRSDKYHFAGQKSRPFRAPRGLTRRIVAYLFG